MINKKLFLLGTFTLVSNSLNGMLKEDLLLLHAQLTALNKTLPERAPSTTAQAAGSPTPAEVKITSDIKAAAASASTQVGAELPAEINDTITPLFSYVRNPTEGADNVSHIWIPLAELTDFYIKSIIDNQGALVEAIHAKLYELYQIAQEVKNKKLLNYLENQGFGQPSINELFLDKFLEPYQEHVIPGLKAAANQDIFDIKKRHATADITQLKKILASTYFNIKFPNLIQKFDRTLKELEAPYNGTIAPERPAEAKKAGEGGAQATESKATSAAAQEISIASTQVRDQYILKARNESLATLKNGSDAHKAALLSFNINHGHLEKLFTAYLNALTGNNQDKLMQAHAALYYIANNYPKTFGVTPQAILTALHDRGFDQPTLNAKAVDYELNRMSAFVKLTPEQLKREADAGSNKNRYERQLGEWGASDLLKKLFPALVPKIAELLSKVQAVKIQ